MTDIRAIQAYPNVTMLHIAHLQLIKYPLLHIAHLQLIKYPPSVKILQNKVTVMTTS